MTEYFIKLNKYQKGMIISLLILSLSLISFMFNSNVRLSKPVDDVPDIVIEDPENIDDTDSDEIFEIIGPFMMFAPIIYLLYKLIWGLLND